MAGGALETRRPRPDRARWQPFEGLRSESAPPHRRRRRDLPRLARARAILRGARDAVREAGYDGRALRLLRPHRRHRPASRRLRTRCRTSRRRPRRGSPRTRRPPRCSCGPDRDRAIAVLGSARRAQCAPPGASCLGISPPRPGDLVLRASSARSIGPLKARWSVADRFVRPLLGQLPRARRRGRSPDERRRSKQLDRTLIGPAGCAYPPLNLCLSGRTPLFLRPAHEEFAAGPTSMAAPLAFLGRVLARRPRLILNGAVTEEAWSLRAMSFVHDPATG